MSIVTTTGELEAIYGAPAETSTTKVAHRLTPQYRTAESIAVRGAWYLRPRRLRLLAAGELGGLVRVIDESTLMLPDRHGNNQIDSLRNIASAVPATIAYGSIGNSPRFGSRPRSAFA